MPMAVAGVTWQFVLEKVEQRCGYLLTSGQFSDCTFVVGSEPEVEVPAHKLILSMASPVFRTMLYGGLPERNKPMIPVSDVDPDTFRALLQYIYTDHIHIVSFDMARNLCLGAIKYKLPHLLNTCTSYNSSVISPRNVCQAYKLARFGEVKTLMDKCIEIMSRKTKEVLNDSSFEDVELDTLMTVLSLDHLNVDSEVDLIHAVVRYVEAEQKRQGQISTPVDNKPPSEKLSELRLEPTPSDEKVLLNGECSSLTSSVESDSEPANKVLTSPTAELNSEPANKVLTSPTAELNSEPANKVLTSPTVESNSEPANKVLTSPTAELNSEPANKVLTSPTAELNSEPANKVLTSPTVESNSEPANKVLTSPTAEPDSELANKVLTSEPTVNRSNLKQEGRRPAGIRAAIEKIRFLSLTPKQFAESHLRYGLLTDGEAYAVLMNIASTNSVEPMPNGFCKTREKRQLRSDVVEEKPNVKPLLQPSTESRSIAAIELSTPADIVEALASSDLNTLKIAARAAYKMVIPFCPSTLPIGFIPRLVAALDHKCSELQLYTCRTLINITMGTRKHKLAIVDEGAIPKLIVLLSHGGEVAEEAAWVLGNIVCEEPNIRDAALNLGVVPAMLPYMHPDTPLTQLRVYVQVYSNFCDLLYCKEIKVNLELLSPALPHITELLALTDESVLSHACCALINLTYGKNKNIEENEGLELVEQTYFSSEGIEWVQTTPGLTERLIALLGHSATQVKTDALGVIGNMLYGTDVQVDRCLEAGCLDHIINGLKCNESLLLKEHAAWAAGNIVGKTDLYIQKVLDKQILEPLIKVLSEGDVKCQNHAAWAVSNMCKYGTAEQLDVLVSAGFLEPYCLLLTSPDNKLALASLQGHSNLLQKVVQTTRLVVLEKLRQIGVPQVLTTLLQHKEEKIRLKASGLMQTYFPDAVPANKAQGTRK